MRPEDRIVVTVELGYDGIGGQAAACWAKTEFIISDEIYDLSVPQKRQYY
jgi:hypothetical protein